MKILKTQMAPHSSVPEDWHRDGPGSLLRVTNLGIFHIQPCPLRPQPSRRACALGIKLMDCRAPRNNTINGAPKVTLPFFGFAQIKNCQRTVPSAHRRFSWLLRSKGKCRSQIWAACVRLWAVTDQVS